MMTPIEIGSGLAATAACLAVIRFAVRANRNWPSFYRIFLLLYFTAWASVLWLQPHSPGDALLIPSLALLAGAVVVGFVPMPPPKNRRQTKNLIDFMETEKSLARFFKSDTGRLFWPILALLIFSVAFRIVMLMLAG